MSDMKDPLRVAVVGAGPSGFYTAESLLRADVDVCVDMYEKLPVPYGLVRYGVAPDHPKLKAVTAVFDRVADMEGFRFLGNVEVGKDVTIAQLDAHYHAIIFAYGVERGNRLGIPGENLIGSFTAHAFVSWYNGHPDFRDLEVDLSTTAAAIIGQGNVALDVARILAKPVDELRRTDIADHALEVLAESQIRDIYVIGRRGPAQVQFVAKELREFATLTGCHPVVAKADLDLGPLCRQELDDPSRADAKSCIGILEGFGVPGQDTRQCHFLFNRMPVELTGDRRVRSVIMRHTKLTGGVFAQRAIALDAQTKLDCGLVVGSIGYKAIGIEGLKLSDNADRLQNQAGRIVPELKSGTGHYVAGWIKRGPKGTIGTNRGDSVATVDALLADRHMFERPKRSVSELISDLKNADVKVVSFANWRNIDVFEAARGARTERPRVKLTSVDEMLGVGAKNAVAG